MFCDKYPDEPKPAVRWLPFQLNPDLPGSGMPRRDYIERKWGPGRGPEVYGRVAAVGASVGLAMAFEKISVQPNTLEAHRLMHYAGEEGRQDEMAEALFKAYFIECENLVDPKVLADIAVGAGLARDAVVAYLASDDDRAEVAHADEYARISGIGGVPFFIFNRKVGVSGAQESDTLLQAMEQASAR